MSFFHFHFSWLHGCAQVGGEAEVVFYKDQLMQFNFGMKSHCVSAH